MEPKSTKTSSSSYSYSSTTTYKLKPLFVPVVTAAGLALGALPFLLIGGNARKTVLRYGPMMAACSGIYCVSNTAMFYLRKKEDKLNDIISVGLATAPYYYKHGGFKGMAQGVVTTGIVYGLMTAAWEYKSENKEEDGQGNA